VDISLVGPGRAGTAVCLAAKRVGHRIVSVAGRTHETTERAATMLESSPMALTDLMPESELLIVAVRDDAIAEVAADLRAPHVRGAVHLSGLTPVDALLPLEESGAAIGVLHPLQTLPTPEAGAAALPGAWIAISTADEGFRGTLEMFARSLGARPFAVQEAARALYHAAAAAAANGTVTVLAVARALFDAAGVPFEAARPLVDAVVANAFSLGPEALTGPIVRGDVGTVTAQIEAVREGAPDELHRFVALCKLIADVAGTQELFEEV